MLKQTLLLLLLIYSTVFGIAQNTTALVAAQLTGTWRTYSVTGTDMFAIKTEFLFTLYADGRIYSIQNGIPYNGTWRVDEDLFFGQYDGDPVAKTQTTFFNGSKWYYTSLGTGTKYIAVRVSAQPSLIPVVFLGKDKTPARPQSNLVSIGQLAGHWKSTSSKGESFQFNIYPDQRLYTVHGENAFNASWTLRGDRFYEYFDYVDEPSVLKTTFFDGKTWKYESLDNGKKYTATKVGAAPQKMAVQPAKPKPESNSSGKSVKQDPGRYSPNSAICFCCNGSHQKDCSSCGGQGGYNERVSYQRYNSNTGNYDTDYRDEWRTCTAWGCNNGKTDCDCCDKRSEELFNPHSTDKVPHDETIIGDWNGGGSDVWTFFTEGGYDYKVFQVISGGQKLIGSWAIEDGLMKIKFTYSKDWEQYSFGAGWTTDKITLTNLSDYSTIGLVRRK